MVHVYLYKGLQFTVWAQWILEYAREEKSTNGKTWTFSTFIKSADFIVLAAETY